MHLPVLLQVLTVMTRLLSRNINWRQTTELYENKVFISILLKVVAKMVSVKHQQQTHGVHQQQTHGVH